MLFWLLLLCVILIPYFFRSNGDDGYCLFREKQTKRHNAYIRTLDEKMSVWKARERKMEEEQYAHQARVWKEFQKKEALNKEIDAMHRNDFC